MNISNDKDEQNLNSQTGAVKTLFLRSPSSYNTPYIAFEFSQWTQASGSGARDDWQTRYRGSAAQLPQPPKDNSGNTKIYQILGQIIYMDLPEQNLTETFSSQWAEGLDYRNSTAVLAGAAAKDALGFIASSAGKGLDTLSSSESTHSYESTKAYEKIIKSPILTGLKTIGNRIGGDVFTQTSNVINTIVDNTKNTVDAVSELTQSKFGKKLNIPQAVSYEQPDFREFEFRYSFVPHTREESIAIKNILSYMKKASLPSYNNGYIDFPNVVRFVVYNNRGLQLFASDYCGISKVQIGYDGESGEQPTFHDDGSPVKIVFEISLKELFIIDRNNVDSFGWK